MNELISQKRLKYLKDIMLIISAALALPLLSLIFFITEIFNNEFFIMLICLFFIFIVSPILFLITVLSPKKWFWGDNKTIFTVLLSFVFWIFLLLTLGKFKEIKEKNFLNSFQPAINYLENYKSVNGIYPINQDNIQIDLKKTPYYSYETINGGKDFIFKVSKSPFFSISYSYCTDYATENCYTHSNKQVDYTSVGKWIKMNKID